MLPEYSFLKQFVPPLKHFERPEILFEHVDVRLRKSDGKSVPLVVSEYAVAGIEGGAAHQLDSSSAAAFIFRTVGQFDGVVDVLS